MQPPPSVIPQRPLLADQRSHQIARARQTLLHDGIIGPDFLAEPWIERSWRRCLATGQRPQHSVNFDVIPRQSMRRIEEGNHALVQAARPVLEKLGNAIADTRYFAILTNADGIVVDVNGPIDRRDRRADLITRIGVDLSEARVGTTAIGAALTELTPVWLHRGEHFFDGNASYSCAGAPLFGPDGHCAGMLDLTGVDVIERPELKHLAAQSARSIENALIPSRAAGGLLIRLSWSSQSLGFDTDGLLGLDRDGFVTGANPAARQMLSMLPADKPLPLHCSELFAVTPDMFFDAAGHGRPALGQSMEVPLWSGLRVHTVAIQQEAAGGKVSAMHHAPPSPLRLKEVETALIRKAVGEAKGNVMKAARMLGVSRATVYRRLGIGKKSG